MNPIEFFVLACWKGACEIPRNPARPSCPPADPLSRYMAIITDTQVCVKCFEEQSSSLACCADRYVNSHVNICCHIIQHHKHQLTTNILLTRNMLRGGGGLAYWCPTRIGEASIGPTMGRFMQVPIYELIGTSLYLKGKEDRSNGGVHADENCKKNDGFEILFAKMFPHMTKRQIWCIDGTNRSLTNTRMPSIFVQIAHKPPIHINQITIALAVVSSIVWALHRLEILEGGRRAPAATRFIAYAPFFLFLTRARPLVSVWYIV